MKPDEDLKQATESTIAEMTARSVLAHQTLDRERKLRSGRVTSEKDLQQAEADHRAACQQARTFGFSEEDINRMEAKSNDPVYLEVRAPFAGEIVERTAVHGALVETGKTLFVLADRSVMWAMLNIPESELARVKVGQTVELQVESLPGRTFVARLTWIGAEVDEKSRMARARAEVANPDGILRANMFAQARILTRTADAAVLLPSSSIQRIGGNDFVFVRLAEALLVIAILFAFLGNFRAGLVVAASIPLSMLFAGELMLQAGISASLLSLGGVDFGLIVDGSVVMVENAMRRLGLRQHELGRTLTKEERMETLASSALEVARPVAFGVGIILVVFLPILALEGVEGKMFKPMALTMIFALAGSLVLALTLTPVLAGLFLPNQVKEQEPWIVRFAHRIYEPVLGLAMRFRALTLLGALAALVGSTILASRMGGEFLPKLGEGAIVGTTVR